MLNRSTTLTLHIFTLQNPQFESTSTYVIFAHMLRQIAALNDHDHHFLVHWIRRYQSTNISMSKITEIKTMVWFGFMVFNTTFNNISVISWHPVLLVEETGVPGENH